MAALTASWYVRNVRDLKWERDQPRGFCAGLARYEGVQVAVNLYVLAPGDPMSMYHWEGDQEGFLVLSGEALLDRRGREAGAAPVGLFPLPARRAAYDRRRRLGTEHDPCSRRPGRRRVRAGIRTPRWRWSTTPRQRRRRLSRRSPMRGFRLSSRPSSARIGCPKPSPRAARDAAAARAPRRPRRVAPRARARRPPRAP